MTDATEIGLPDGEGRLVDTHSATAHASLDTPRSFPCDACGADFEFSIGAQKLQCPFCHHVKELSHVGPASADDASDDRPVISERDLKSTFERLTAGHGDKPIGDSQVKCGSCAATVVFSGALTSSECGYCGSPIQRDQVHKAESRLAVDGMLPFRIDKARARESMKKWVASRWFAPNAFKKRGIQGKFSGIYFPFWTYDAMTHSSYVGSRGDYYWVQVGSGDNKRRERRTRWSHTSGQFQRFFDDVLVSAAQTVQRKLMHELEPWPLDMATPFDAGMLAGFQAMTYDIPLDEGFNTARARIDEALDVEVRRRIGGDVQRIDNISTQMDALTYKHLLLPVWILAYKFGERTFQVVVNACTGEVNGERPWSWVKIALASIAGLAVAGAFALFVGSQ